MLTLYDYNLKKNGLNHTIQVFNVALVNYDYQMCASISLVF